MNILEFMKAIQIEDADAQVFTFDNGTDDIRVSWVFEVVGYPTLTHQRVSRIIQSHDFNNLHLLVDEVKQIIEVNRNAQ